MTPKPPYYAVIFTSVRTDADEKGYAEAANRMVSLAEKEAGFLGIESVREKVGITVSYWKDLASIQQWKNNIAHTEIREKGKALWYKQYVTRICLVERAYNWEKESK